MSQHVFTCGRTAWCVRRNRVVLASRCWRSGRDVGDEHCGRRGQSSRSPRRARISVKTIAQGRPGELGCTCGSTACFFAARGPWAPAGARPSLRPPSFRGRHAAAQLGRHPPRDRGRMPASCLTIESGWMEKRTARDEAQLPCPSSPRGFAGQASPPESRMWLAEP